LVSCATLNEVSAVTGAGVDLSPPPTRRKQNELTSNVFFIDLL
jgi:hypothetical protein